MPEKSAPQGRITGNQQLAISIYAGEVLLKFYQDWVYRILGMCTAKFNLSISFFFPVCYFITEELVVKPKHYSNPHSTPYTNCVSKIKTL